MYNLQPSRYRLPQRGKEASFCWSSSHEPSEFCRLLTFRVSYVLSAVMNNLVIEYYIGSSCFKLQLEVYTGGNPPPPPHSVKVNPAPSLWILSPTPARPCYFRQWTGLQNFSPVYIITRVQVASYCVTVATCTLWSACRRNTDADIPFTASCVADRLTKRETKCRNLLLFVHQLTLFPWVTCGVSPLTSGARNSHPCLQLPSPCAAL